MKHVITLTLFFINVVYVSIMIAEDCTAGWDEELIVKQDNLVFPESIFESGNFNEHSSGISSPAHVRLFSEIGVMEQYISSGVHDYRAGSDNKYYLKLVYGTGTPWPSDGTPYSIGTPTQLMSISWKQSSWLTASIIEGYEAVNIPPEDADLEGALKFVGLGQQDTGMDSDKYCFLNGYMGSMVANCVGVTNAGYNAISWNYQSGIPGFNGQISTYAELFILTCKPILTLQFMCDALIPNQEIQVVPYNFIGRSIDIKHTVEFEFKATALPTDNNIYNIINIGPGVVSFNVKRNVNDNNVLSLYPQFGMDGSNNVNINGECIIGSSIGSYESFDMIKLELSENQIDQNIEYKLYVNGQKCSNGAANGQTFNGLGYSTSDQYMDIYVADSQNIDEYGNNIDVYPNGDGYVRNIKECYMQAMQAGNSSFKVNYNYYVPEKLLILLIVIGVLLISNVIFMLFQCINKNKNKNKNKYVVDN